MDFYGPKSEIKRPDVWDPSHTIRGEPVMRVILRGEDRRRVKGLWWFRQDGTRTSPGAGHPARPYNPAAQAVPASVAVAVMEPEPEQSPVEIEIPEARESEQVTLEATSPTGTLEILDAEVAAAVLRAAAWPIYQEACGDAQTTNGDVASVIGRDADGAKIVRVCTREGKWCTVLVPKHIGFQSVEEADGGR